MKILLSSVKESSKEFLLEAAMNLGGMEGRAKPGQARARLRVTPASDRWYISGPVEGSFPFTCDRCGAAFDGALSGEIGVVVLARQVGDLSPEDSDEVLVLPSGSQEIDLSDAIHEALLLDLPIQLLCREDCAGLCYRCGADLNAGPCGCPPEPDSGPSALEDLKRLMDSAADPADENEV